MNSLKYTRWQMLPGTSILVLVLFFQSSCKKPLDDKRVSDEKVEVPSNFPMPVYDFTSDKFSDKKVNLGRKLFYDPFLSINGTISCATCHAQVHGFADHGASTSKGIFNRKGKRNSPAIFNMAWNPSFMWDGGINHIEVMPIAPLTDSNEMGETMAGVVSKLNGNQEYKSLFYEAFGIGPVNDQQMLVALSQFMSRIVSADSKYDRVLLGKEKFNQSEEEGYTIFKEKCSGCHKEPLFTDYSFRNNGLDSLFTDLGRFRITLSDNDKGKFKVPTLRNITLTNPYMHDGRFATLDDVLEHYVHGIVNSSTLDPILKTQPKLTKSEKVKIIAFLSSLTDYSMLSNYKISEP